MQPIRYSYYDPATKLNYVVLSPELAAFKSRCYVRLESTRVMHVVVLKLSLGHWKFKCAWILVAYQLNQRTVTGITELMQATTAWRQINQAFQLLRWVSALNRTTSDQNRFRLCENTRAHSRKLRAYMSTLMPKQANIQEHTWYT